MTENRDKRACIRFGRHKMPLPGSRAGRIVVGSGLVASGVVGFLPVVGFWMLPLGLAVLSIDSAPIRRGRRRLQVRWGRWRSAHKRSQDGEKTP